LIRISDRDSTGTYLRFHTSTRARAYACACHARPSPPSIRANRATQRHYRARAYPSNSPRNHSRRTIYSDYFHYYYVYFLFHPRPHAHPHAPIVCRCARYVPVNHASCCGNNSSSAMLFTSMCCPLRTSRYVACHARRRCDGPCELVAFRVRMSTHACRVM